MSILYTNKMLELIWNIDCDYCLISSRYYLWDTSNNFMILYGTSTSTGTVRMETRPGLPILPYCSTVRKKEQFHTRKRKIVLCEISTLVPYCFVQYVII